MERIISAAKNTDADAIHQGLVSYLRMLISFAYVKNSIAFIGPSAEVIDMGNKSKRKKTMMEAGVPVVPGTKDLSMMQLQEKLDEISYQL